ncbi:MAG TPA: MoxR family ATPase, partial [Longimicrobium sp.]|nr:MoxR family ATPase [Longimicrobium sp.]
MSQLPRFDPSGFTAPADSDAVGDRRDGAIYHYTPEIVLAVRVALATGRPLLVRGPSGSGKSSLAQNIARVLGWDFVDQVITSRTQAQDLLWTVDHIRRLRDAHTNQLGPFEAYVHPGPLWRAFDPTGARRQADRSAATEPPPSDAAAPRRVVVLLDEIDKADPDVPNNLLVALGSLEFLVSDLGLTVRGRREMVPLIVLTTNDERDIPDAFL